VRVKQGKKKEKRRKKGERRRKAKTKKSESERGLERPIVAFLSSLSKHVRLQ
jgi:hypothetical protein